MELGLHRGVESIILCGETRLSRKYLRSSINQNVASITKAKICHLGGFRNGAKRKDLVIDDASRTPMQCFHPMVKEQTICPVINSKFFFHVPAGKR